ncbi:uncharacterized protein LOC124455139 isoform X2 [Xenia sp. Carnegie-2017]|uniref:uncharacterized protein LOC124455139 isoform X2 n=1 Tax=Xenia sp. Carnegie-2017 TaxID=2897299 RepID=UPI001F033C0F|nr:uncharacterized protein LOC124455139 isoform X2 [Xenia sp. Carnegie-2017]
MVKLKELINKCVQDDSEKLINFTRFLKECEATTSDDEPHQPLTKRQKITRHQVEELEDDEDEADVSYQKIKLKGFNASRRKVTKTYEKMINAVSRSVQGRFEEFRVSVVFKNLPVILDFAMWPKEDEALKRYGDKAILELKEFYQALLVQNGCNIDKVVSEWNRLKV